MSMGVMYFGYVCDVFFGLQDLMYNFVMALFSYFWNDFVVFRHPSSTMLCYNIHEASYLIATLFHAYVALSLSLLIDFLVL